MMTAMNQVELPPLRNRERSQYRMFENFCIRSKSRRASRHDFIHLGNLRNDLRDGSLRWQAPREGHLRRFHSIREVSESGYNECSQTLAHRRGVSLSLIRSKQARKTLGRPRVRQIQVFEDFGNTPFLRMAAIQLFRRQSLDGGVEFILQTFQVRVHEGN